MNIKKTYLTIFVIFLMCLLLLGNPVVAKNTYDDGHERYRIKFNLQIVDAFTDHPLNGVIRVYAVFNDKLWKESLDMGEWRELLTLSFRGGQASFEAPLHGRYSLDIEPEEGVSKSPYGLLPRYEDASRLIIFDGNPTVKMKIKLYPVGYVFAKIYSPSGSLIKFRDWDDPWEYNRGLFYGTCDNENYTKYFLTSEDEFAILVPAGCPSKVYWVTYVPDFGLAWLQADNDGRGYVIRRGGYIVINLVYESAKTMLRKALEFIDEIPKNLELSDNVTSYLTEAKKLLDNSAGLSEKSKALNGWKALELTFKAWRQAILDYSWYRIRKHRVGRLVLDLPSGVKANMTLDYIDLRFFVGVKFDEELRQYYYELNGFSKYGHLGFYPTMNLDGTIPEAEFQRQYRYVKNEHKARQFNTADGDLAYHPIFESGFKHPSEFLEVPEKLKKLLIPFNVTALLKITKTHIKDLSRLVKKYHVNLKTIEAMIEWDRGGVPYYKPFLWNGLIYFRPLTLEEKASIAKQLNSLIKNLMPEVEVTTYFSNPLNPEVAYWLKVEDPERKYDLRGIVDAVNYFVLGKGIYVDTIGFQIHMLHPTDQLNLIEIYEALNRLYKILPESIGVAISEFDIPSKIGENEAFYGLQLAEYVNEDYQARLIKDCMIVFLGFPRLRGVGYYFGVDPQSCEGQAGYCGIYRGLIRSDYTPKPAYHAVINLFKSLIYEGRCSKEVTTLAGWYNVTLYREGGQPIETYRIHVDGGSTTRLIVRFFENETLKVEVERLRSELEAYKSEIDELQKTVNRLQQQLAEKDETIHRLKKELSKHRETITVTITKTLKTTETVVSPSRDTSTLVLIALVAGLAVVMITVAIMALRRRANYVRR